MVSNNTTIGAILIFSGLGLLFLLWISVISPNTEMRTLWVIITTIFWIQLQDINQIFWVISDEFESFLFAVCILALVSLPVEIFGLNIEIFVYSSIVLILAGVIAVIVSSK